MRNKAKLRVVSEKEMLKQTNKLTEGLKIVDYQLLKHKSMLNQNIVTEDDQGNVVRCLHALFSQNCTKRSYRFAL